jgi:hypothetical protein
MAPGRRLAHVSHQESGRSCRRCEWSTAGGVALFSKQHYKLRRDKTTAHEVFLLDMAWAFCWKPSAALQIKRRGGQIWFLGTVAKRWREKLTKFWKERPSTREAECANCKGCSRDGRRERSNERSAARDSAATRPRLVVAEMRYGSGIWSWRWQRIRRDGSVMPPLAIACSFGGRLFLSINALKWERR